jgi:hypothetical protein
VRLSVHPACPPTFSKLRDRSRRFKEGAENRKSAYLEYDDSDDYDYSSSTLPTAVGNDNLLVIPGTPLFASVFPGTAG